MGRSKSRRRQDRRDDLFIANRRLPVRNNMLRPTPLRFTPLTVFEDRRQWHPERAHRPAMSFSQARHRLEALAQPAVLNRNGKNRDAFAHLRSFNSFPSGIRFARPDRVLVCVRRNIRKEVLHALKKTGRSGGRQKRPRFNWFSTIKCRR